VLSDGTSSYLYGLGRICEEDTGWVYYLTDALGSVRQLTDSNALIQMVQNYDPYGNVMSTMGEGESNYGFTGEWTDGTGLQHLRARYLDTGIGRFISRDTWPGDYNRPVSLNGWMYVEGNPVNYTDPSGQICLDPWAPAGVHFDPDRGCDYPKGSTGAFWFRKDPPKPLGEDTAIIDMPWIDEQSQEMWNRYPNSCGASALYMFLKGEGKSVEWEKLVQQLQAERPAGYDSCTTKFLS
jgi:RHS repeat-associated protein